MVEPIAVVKLNNEDGLEKNVQPGHSRWVGSCPGDLSPDNQFSVCILGSYF
jgi:hypothetical protein